MYPDTSLVDCLYAYRPIPSITIKYAAKEIIIPVSKFASVYDVFVWFLILIMAKE
jgi:hypothetical protein